jgi:MFS family permease
MDYLHFVRKNHRFLSFALLLIWFSSPGQTFFISLFSGHLRAEFGLSHGGFGSLYSLATLASGLSMIWVGRKIDDIDLRIYSTLVCAGVTVACFFMATVTSLILLCLAIFALRITGQGLMTHTAATSMARYFDDERGKALGVASLGRPAGEATFPLIGVLLISTIGWRWSWTVIGGGYALLLIPAVLWLLKGHGERHRRLIARNKEQEADGRFLGRQWSRREVIRDLHFYLILPAVVAPSFIMTGVSFHQIHLVESKGWSLTLFAGSYIGHAAAAVAASLLSGPLVDRVGAVKLLRYYLSPLAVALLVLAAFDHESAAFLFMIASGVTVGMTLPTTGAIWAEIYGVAHLGAIRALVSACMVFSTALAPVALGWLIDFGISLEAIFVMCFVYVVASSALAMTAGFRTPATDTAR